MKKIILLFFTAIIFIMQISAQQTDAYIDDFRVNDDATNRTQSGSRIGVDSVGNFVVAWNDLRNSVNFLYNQVFYQLFDKNGNRIGNNVSISNDTTYLLGVTKFSGGQFIVSWFRIFNSSMNAEMYFQRFNRFGNPIQQPLRVVDSVFSSLALGYGDISSDSSGNFVIAWERYVGPSNQTIVYCQRFDSSANRIGTPLIVNDEFPYGLTDIYVVMDFSGSFIVTWKDIRNNIPGQKGDIFFQRFDKNGNKLGGNIMVNDDNDSTKEQTLPWISSDRNGRFVITWSDRRSLFNDLQIYLQVYDSLGLPVGPNKRADESFGMPGFSKVGVKSDGKFLIGWTDDWYAGRYQYFGKRYTRNGDTIGNLYMVPQTSPGSSVQSPEDIKIVGDRVYSVWGDTRNGNSDIYCNVRSFQNPDSVISGLVNVSSTPQNFRLYPAFPNPFNPETKLRFQLSKADVITLIVYDISGKEVTNLTLGLKQPGTYDIGITGERLASGVYFVKLFTKGGQSETQKIVLVK
jgi:Secretion system C-terminal sorting domain